MEEFSRVAGQRKAARAESTRELAEWGGDAQETDGYCRMRSDWAVLAIGGTTGCSTVNSDGTMVGPVPGVMRVRRYKGEWLQASHTC